MGKQYSERIRQQIEAVKDLLRRNPGVGIIAIASYETEKDYRDFFPNGDYDFFRRDEREFAEALVDEGLDANVVFQPIKYGDYLVYIALNNLPDGPAARSAFAAYLSGNKE